MVHTIASLSLSHLGGRVPENATKSGEIQARHFADCSDAVVPRRTEGRQGRKKYKSTGASLWHYAKLRAKPLKPITIQEIWLA
jgi:hypothetical protein